jgi:hypothetical protein
MVKLIEPAFVIVRVSVDVDVNLSPLNPSVPEVPDVPLVPLVPDVPDEPDEPDVPDVPDVADVPLVPEVPDVPLVPDEPAAPFVPANICCCKKSKLLSISAAVSGAPLGILVTNAIIYILLL